MQLPDLLPRMPPLPALRAFESAARHNSFSLAAKELSLTHGAIGHQVRSLEDELGVQLFARVGRGLQLTPEGKILAERVRAALLDIAAAVHAVKRKINHQKLTISVVPSFAARWLAPRLGSFIEQHAELEIFVQTSNILVDFARDEVDIGLRVGLGDWPGVHAEKFLDDCFYPVCAPSFNNGKLPQHPSELLNFPLLLSDREPWTPWFQAAGIDAPEPHGATYDNSVMLLQTVKKGHAIGLTRDVLVKEDLARGDVVRLFDISIVCPMAYYFVCPPELLHTKKVQSFRDWLWQEVRNYN